MRIALAFPQPFPGEIKAESPSPEPIPSIEQRAQRTSKARSGTGATHSPQGEHGEDPPFDGSEHGATILQGSARNLGLLAIEAARPPLQGEAGVSSVRIRDWLG